MNGTLNTVKARVDAVADNTQLTVNTQPVTCKLELTAACTLQCRFCHNSAMKAGGIRQHFISNNDFVMALDYIQSIPSIKEVGLFYMGESGLYPHLAEAYAMVKERGYFTYLTTNGTVIRNILPAIPYIDSLKVSWNYKNRTDFMAKTGMPAGMYDLIHHNIETFYYQCHKHGKTLAVSTVLDSTKEEYEDAISTLKFDEHYWIPLQNQGGTQDAGAGGVLGQADNLSTPLPCWSLFKGLYIDCDLNVRTCCYGHGDEHILGNIKDPDNIKSRQAFMEEQLQGKIPAICRDCLNCTEVNDACQK